MLFQTIFDRFVAKSPVCVMVRGLLERALSPQRLDRLFEQSAQRQYTRELLFSTTVDLMAMTVCRIHPSVHAAYQAHEEQVPVSVRALYDKLQCLEPTTSAALVQHTVESLEPLIRCMKATVAPLVQGYKTKILDGNHLGHSERRPQFLREVAAGPLPGQTLVVLEPETGLATGVLCCEDGHPQERKILDDIWPLVEKNDLWIADRNFCTTKFLFGLILRQSKFIVRQHAATLRWERESSRRRVGRTTTGVVYEQNLWLQDETGKQKRVRRIILELDKPTRDGDRTIQVLTNLPAKVGAVKVVALYRQRWTIEQLFQRMTVLLRCEVNTLAYPKAALFGFCVALAASNVLATVKAALRAAQDEETEEEVSDFYRADELAKTYRGMMIALPGEHWKYLGELAEEDMVAWLLEVARQTAFKRYRKHRRGPKKPRPPRTKYAKAKHVATARLIAEQIKK